MRDIGAPTRDGPPPPVPTPAERAAYAQWDQPYSSRPVPRNTGWVSIGVTGFSHAPVVQVTVAQRAKPNVDLIAISAVFERAGVNV
jgi:pyocin large subunit-like protein